MSKFDDELAGAGAGAATGAAIGSTGGAEGAIVGALIGAIVGAFAGDLAHVTPQDHKSAPAPTTGGVPSNAPDEYLFDTPLCTPETIMMPLNKRATTPIENPAQGVERDQKRRRKGPGSRTQVLYEGPEYVSDLCRDFSGIQRTVVNPITGRIIGYKGIRSRKRKLDSLKKYSSFWRDYDREKSSFRAARSPGIWDSARR